MKVILTPKALHNKAQGKRSGASREAPPWVINTWHSTPTGLDSRDEDLSNPVGVHRLPTSAIQGGPAAPLTLGFEIERLWCRGLAIAQSVIFLALFSLLAAGCDQNSIAQPPKSTP